MTPVDLGLPSGTKWAPMNVGASAPEEAGLYFSWGNTDGHTSSEGYAFTEDSYKNTPGVEISGNIPLTHDAARVNMGGNWRMPTQTEFAELVNNCTYLWTTQNGVNGAQFTSKINGNTIFFPATGHFYGTEREAFGVIGSYWSSTNLDTESSYTLYTESEKVDPNYDDVRSAGFTIRAVQS